MRTVSTICASGAGIGISVLGFSLVSEDGAPARAAPPSRPPPPGTAAAAETSHQQSTRTPSRDMTATATATYTLPSFDHYAFTFSTPDSFRRVRDSSIPRTHSDNVIPQLKTRSGTRGSLSMPPHRPATAAAEGWDSRSSTPGAQPQTWLRRLSSNMSTSRESSRTPHSRPSSSYLSRSNGSLRLSNTESTTPIIPDTASSSPAPNKLVKRTSSLRSTNSSSKSRLPVPVFQRPNTSHQRSATLRETLSSTPESDRVTEGGSSEDARDHRWRHYFGARVSSSQGSGNRRRSSSIPNPIKRVYPDRRYIPTMVSARGSIRQAEVEEDDDFSWDDEGTAGTNLKMLSSVASSPLPTKTTDFEDASRTKRSFSISDLLSAGTQPRWRRPASSKNEARVQGGKSLRRSTKRIVSAPQSSMGSSLSSSRNEESGPPNKRRDTSSLGAASRSIHSSSSTIQTTDFAAPSNHPELSRLPSFQPPSSRSSSAGTPQNGISSVSTEQRRVPSTTATSSNTRQTRLSSAPSVITSTIDSDSEYRSIGDASTDYQSDMVYDSFPTRTTRSSLGRRGPNIETIFDDSPPTFSSEKSMKLRDFLSDGNFTLSDPNERYRYSTIEEEESISTPVRSLRDKSLTSSPAVKAGAPNALTSSPPTMREFPDPDEIDWDAPDEADAFHTPASNNDYLTARSSVADSHLELGLPFRLSPFALSQHTSSTTSTPKRLGHHERSTIFDWSEVQPSPNHHDQSPPRPKTVHGKKDPDTRGSRTVGRRAPSAMHARSHSVPVVPDVENKKSNAVANKFGTWGVGSKGVTEDWNEDFDFDMTTIKSSPGTILAEEKRVDSGHEMFVPKVIREQQENVVANIGLLREWGLLIEELKELRVRAAALDMMKGPYARDWKEVDAMIELADQESEEHTLEPRRSPPSSPGFDYSAFEEPLPETTTAGHKRQSFLLPEPAFGQFQAPPGVAIQEFADPNLPAQPSPTRPRKDSEAVARSVIEALQTKRTVSEPTKLEPVPQSKKVPFDTATLRHIVPYVNGLKRKVKDGLRETEGLYTSPRRRSSSDVRFDDSDDDEPPFRSPFNEPDSPSTTRHMRRSRAITDHDESDFSGSFTDDLARKMRSMRFASPPVLSPRQH